GQSRKRFGTFPGRHHQQSTVSNTFVPTKSLPTTVANGSWNAGCGLFGVKAS
ncbi:hypothetical protein NPIL_528481, partial [Nephila pilipes]